MNIKINHAIYKTVLIIVPLNLQTITVTLDVVKWSGRGTTAPYMCCVQQVKSDIDP